MTEELPAEAFYDLSEPRPSLAVSPDGDRVAFVVRESDPDEDERRDSVFVAPTDGSRDPHRLTRVSDAGGAAWSPDGSRLGVVMARERDVELRVGRDDDGDDAGEDETGADGAGGDGTADGSDEGDGSEGGDGGSGDGEGEDEDANDGGSPGDDEPKPQVWVYDLERGGDARQVTDREEGVAGFDWGPDGERVVVAARDPDEDDESYLKQVRDGGPIEVERLQHKFDGEDWLDEVPSYLFVYDVETRSCERLDATAVPANVGDGLAPAWGPDGRIAYRGFDPDAFDCDPDDTYAQDVYAVDPDGGDPERITAGELAAGAPVWSPDGRRLAFPGRPPGNLYRPLEVFVYDRETGEYGPVTEGVDRTLSYWAEPRWLDGGTLSALIGDGGRSRFVRLPVEGPPERVFDALGDGATVRGADVAADGSRVACLRSAPAEGTDVFAFDADRLDPAADVDGDSGDEDPLTRLSTLNGDLVGSHAGPALARERFTVESEGEDPVEVEALALYPPEFDPATDDPRPLVLSIHGGPMAYDEPAWAFEDLFWTTRGYVVWKVNYRGSTSYGRAFCETLRGRWNTVEVDDLLAGTDAAVDRGYADPDRLFVTGFSQGGVNTAYLITRTDRFAAAAPEHGIYDVRSSFGTDDSHNWLEADFGLPWENPETYDAVSSIDDVGAVDTPTLVTAGERDWRCPPTQAEQLYVSLRKRGVPAKLVVYQGERHGVGDPDRAIHRLETLESWFRRHDPAVGDGERDGEGGNG